MDTTHPTELLNTALAGRYTIARLVGEGGMATVYLARDVRHKRNVALKVLKPDLGAIVGVERFLSEIQVTANLQHPNLLPLFDSGTAGGLLFYVMPFVEGESLRARLEHEKQLPIDEAIHLTVAVASALEYAHQQGVIHRDLKPENILLQAGEPMLADFGIALALANAGGQRITQTGLSLGTPQYMSPEQATGDRIIDRRSDIYSLGAVTYEMLTGEPPHTGSTSQAIIARVLTEKPRPIRASRPNVPAHVAAAIEHALEKLPADRWATAKEFGEALSGLRPMAIPSKSAALPHTTRAVPSSRRQRALHWVAWGLAAAGLAGTAFFATRKLPAPLVGRFLVELPDSVTVTANHINSVALSRDGTQLAILGVKGSTRAIYLRRMDDLVAQVVRGTEGAAYHSFSPDGRWLLFMAGGSLKKVPVTGGTPQTLIDTAAASSSSWGDGNNVVYVLLGALWLVSSDRGNPRLLAKPDTSRGFVQYLQPDLLPGGKYALITISTRVALPDSARLGVVSLVDGSVTDLGIRGINPHYVAPGRIVFGVPGGTVYSTQFSLRTRTVTGAMTLLLDEVRQSASYGVGFTVSQGGVIAYDVGGVADLQSMYVVDRQGVERELKGPMRWFREPRVSPDGLHVAVRIGRGTGDGGLWIYDIAAGTLTRLTADSASIRGEWTRDGARVVYTDHAQTNAELLVSRPWNGNGDTRVLGRGGQSAFEEVAIGPSGGYSAIRRGGTPAGGILLAPTDSLDKMRPFLSEWADEISPRISPDGHLLAYASNQSGDYEVYLRQIPGPGPVIPVSVGGGSEPMWGKDDATLYYRGPTRMMAATVRERPALAITRRDSLFADGYRHYLYHAAYDVLPNGKDFLMTKGPASASKIYIIVNWPQMLRNQAGTASGH